MRSFRRILIRNDRCPYKEGRSGQRPTQVEDHVKTPGNEPSGGEGEMPPKTPNLPTPWSQTPGIQNCEGINVCCLNLLSCGSLQQTNTLPDQKTQTGRKNLKKRVRLYAQLYAIYKRVTLAQRTWRSWTWRVAKPTELDGREVTAGSWGGSGPENYHAQAQNSRRARPNCSGTAGVAVFRTTWIYLMPHAQSDET